MWLRQAQPPCYLLLLTLPEPVEGRSYSSLWYRELRSQTFSLCSITVLFITTLGAWACRRHILTSHLGAWACRRHILTSTLGAWACRRHHYFYCIKICALYRTSLMLLWELKNAIISQNLRGLCDIKTNIKTTHSGFDKLSHLLFHYTVPEPPEGTFSLLISLPEPVEGTLYLFH